jgi:hypothetical protein
MVVSVNLLGGPEVGTPEVIRARSIADKVFASADLQLEWCTSAKRCAHWDDRIVVTLIGYSFAAKPPEALAEALIFEGRNVRIFLDRVNASIDRPLASRLLGYVLAHEIAHMLQACDRHSKTGVMKAKWSAWDYGAMNGETLLFEAHDVDLLHIGLAKRRAALATMPFRRPEN